ncbi:MAG TPA: hypothetical protein VFZ26_05530, partial [Gemmatimonadales bacterium]
PDPGAGAYVTRDLFWYRSTLAHNAPRLDGRSQVAGDATCAAFDVSGAWGWIEGEFPPFVRTVVAGPGYLADVVEFSAAESHHVELPWHPSGRIEMLTPGTWVPETLEEEFVERCERFVPASADSLHLRATEGDRALNLHLLFEGELLRAVGPGLPGAGPAEFLLARATGRGLRFFAVLEPGSEARVRGLRASGDVLEIERDGETDRHVRTGEGWEVTTAGATVALRGRRRPEVDVARPLIDPHRPLPVRGVALRLYEPPALDGTAGGFDESEPLLLDHEDQYRRSEEPYPGPEEFSARALVGWGEGELYVAVAVTTPVPSFRAADAPALLLDNEPDDIHSDGVQLYVRTSAAGPVYGFLVVPDPAGDGVRVRGASGTAGRPEMVRGAWGRTEDGYVITVAIAIPDWEPRVEEEIGFDLLVNRTEPDRQRRAGQLVWSGGGGWAYLRGDRQDPASLGVLELR